MINLEIRDLVNGETSANFDIVGQAVGNASSTEFIIHKSWTYGEIAQTALLFAILACVVFQILYSIFKRERKYV